MPLLIFSGDDKVLLYALFQPSVFLKNMDPWQDMKGSRETGCGLRRRMRIRGSRKKRGGDTKEGGGKMTVSPTAEQL